MFISLRQSLTFRCAGKVILLVMVVLSLGLAGCANLETDLTVYEEERWQTVMTVDIPPESVALAGGQEALNEELDKIIEEQTPPDDVEYSIEREDQSNGAIVVTVRMAGQGLTQLNETIFGNTAIVLPREEGGQQQVAIRQREVAEWIEGGNFTLKITGDRIIASNADTIEAGTAIWHNPSEIQVTLTPKRRSILPEVGLTAVIAGIGVAVICLVFIIAAGGLLLVLRSRRQPAQGPSPGVSAPVAPVAVPGSRGVVLPPPEPLPNPPSAASRPIAIPHGVPETIGARIDVLRSGQGVLARSYDETFKRHLTLTAALGLFFQVFLCGTFAANITTWLVMLPFVLGVTYLLVGYRLNGRWPHVHLVHRLGVAILGERRSTRRHLILTLLVGGLLLIPVYFNLADSTLSNLQAGVASLGPNAEALKSSVQDLLADFSRPAADGVISALQTLLGSVVSLIRRVFVDIARILVFFFTIFGASYFVTGYWLRGEWPLAAQIEQRLGDRQSSRRHLVFTGVSALIVHTLLFAPGAADMSSWLRGWFTALTATYFLVGYALTRRLPLVGGWPTFGRFLQPIVGLGRSLRRRVFLTLLLSAWLWWPTGILFDPDRIQFTLTILGLTFFLLGFSTNWRETGNEAHLVLDSLVDKVPQVRAAIWDRISARQIPDLTMEEVEVAERSLYQFGALNLDAVSVRQFQFTQGRARLILRVVEYGTDLYIRWESYFDFSGRRLWQLIGLFLTLWRNLTINLIGTDIYTIWSNIYSILFGWTSDATTGSRTENILPFDAEGLFSTIPSHMLDSLYALEEAVNQSASEVLDEVALQTGREDRIELSINRSLGKQSQLF